MKSIQTKTGPSIPHLAAKGVKNCKSWETIATLPTPNYRGLAWAEQVKLIEADEAFHKIYKDLCAKNGEDYFYKVRIIEEPATNQN